MLDEKKKENEENARVRSVPCESDSYHSNSTLLNPKRYVACFKFQFQSGFTAAKCIRFGSRFEKEDIKVFYYFYYERTEIANHAKYFLLQGKAWHSKCFSIFLCHCGHFWDILCIFSMKCFSFLCDRISFNCHFCNGIFSFQMELPASNGCNILLTFGHFCDVKHFL